MKFLLPEWLTKPVWMWLAFLAIVIALLGITFAILAAGIGWSLWKTRAPVSAAT